MEYGEYSLLENVLAVRLGSFLFHINILHNLSNIWYQEFKYLEFWMA